MQNIRFSNRAAVIGFGVTIVFATFFGIGFGSLTSSEARGTNEIARNYVPDGLTPDDWQAILAAKRSLRPTTISQQAYFKPALVGNTQSGDQFGFSVAVSGDTVVVGAINEDSSTMGVNSTPDENSSNSGAAYVFTRTAGPWTQQAYLKPATVGTTQAGDRFGYSVAISGDTIVVGASAEDSSTTGVNSTPNENSTDSGAAYVFTRTAGLWTQQAYLKPAAVGTMQTGDEFGGSVAVSGDTIVVGAIGEDSSTTGVNSAPNENSVASGAAYVFTRNAGIWTQQAYIKPTGVGTTQVADLFGYSVAVAGDTVVIGAALEDSSTTGVNSAPNESSTNAGAAYVFTRNSELWTQQAYLKPNAVGIRQDSDQFGISVTISDDTIVVGANWEDSSTTGVNSVPNDSGIANDSGAAYIFMRSGGIWTQQAYLKPDAVGTTQAADQFGWSVAVSDGTVVVGAHLEDGNATGINGIPNEVATGAGTAYVFTRSSGGWTQAAYLKPSAIGTNQSGDNLGGSVAIAGDVLVVGARGEDSNTTDVNSIPNDTGGIDFNAGATYLFGGFQPAPARSFCDFDGDGKTDLSIFRPNGAEWWWLKSSNGGNGAVQFGASTDTIAPADFTGDGKTDVAFWRPSTGQWFVLRSEDFSFYAFPFGTTGDVPVPADYDGDGKADAAVFRASAATWFINKSSGGTEIVGFGAAGDKPVNADYDGDGKADIAVFRPNGANGAEWWIRRSSNSTVFATQFGSPTDKAVPADYTGDGKADIAFWTPSSGNWFVLRSEDYSYFGFPFGSSTDIPSPGDYDGDGKTDAAVFRPSNSTWYAQRSTAGILIQQFGAPGDVPVPSAYVR